MLLLLLQQAVVQDTIVLCWKAPKAKQVKVEIKAKDKVFFGNKSLSLDFSSRYFARAKTTRGRLVSARVCPEMAQTYTYLKVRVFLLAPPWCCQEAAGLAYAHGRVSKVSPGRQLVLSWQKSSPCLRARANFKTELTSTEEKNSRCRASSPSLHTQLNAGVGDCLIYCGHPNDMISV